MMMTMTSISVEKLKAAAEEGTLEHAYEPVRFGNAGGLSALENLDQMPGLSMNALIFSSKLIWLS